MDKINRLYIGVKFNFFLRGSHIISGINQFYKTNHKQVIIAGEGYAGIQVTLVLDYSNDWIQ
jgi:hypothetical protein